MDRKVSGDKGRPVSVPRTSSTGSWTGSEVSAPSDRLYVDVHNVG